MTYLTPTAVAKLKECGLGTVQRAMANGTLKCIELLGPKGKPTGYGILAEDALGWNPRPYRKESEK